MALGMGVACGTVLGGTGPCFWRTYDGNLDDRGSLNVPQKGSYIIPAGKVKELSGVTGKATFTPAGLAFAITARGQKTPAASTLLAGPMEDFQVVGAGGTRHQHAGYPRFEEASFDAAFPFGTVHLRDKALPYKVDVRGFSPFIPGDSAASSTPVASLEYVVENVTGEPLEVSVCGFGTALMEGYHEYRESDTLRGLVTCSAAKGTAIGAGSYALVTDATGDIT